MATTFFLDFRLLYFVLWSSDGNVVAKSDMDGKNIQKMEIQVEQQMPDGLALDFVSKFKTIS